jgi:hypothetical protein
MANLFYNIIPALGGQSFFEEMLARFQAMIRLKTPESYRNFFNYVGQRQRSKPLNELLDMLLQAQRQLGQRIINTLPANSLNIAFTCAMVMMSSWRQQLNEELVLIHDASTNMSKEHFIWDTLMSPELAPATVGYDRRKWTFPIGVSKTTFEKSEHWSGLQLADVTAGAFCRAARWAYGTQDMTDNYGRDLTTVIEGIPVIPMLPGTEVTPEELGTVGSNAGDPNEFLAKIIRGARAKGGTEHGSDI